ncbi:ActS/PrrB/RegB family redox-sensitive histidine kinase [Pelagibacterium xiamenense]|uniref:ActS/PrrB/RegB family redox-sensitive histidine kinase n=1 Tax=Pelagibacterium xiamenense TaxID=2901140 RepID=UPI001E43D88F|nr:ActS/PrrB/RegB family redox-sensitive histidine kinase [Pelagibacterium xiamenense]MCD7058519.1 ActS/PrrB/RegB family redox-sensitive histidine kinase [Pelagibacterium xiamenense]
MYPLADSDAHALAHPAHPLRLDTLILLRWLAIAGQAASVLFVHYGLGYPLPLVACLTLIGLSVLLNVGLLIRFGPAHRPGRRLAFLQLAYDCLQVGGLLYLTGGLGNPFALLLIAPVSVSASVLPQRETVLLAVLAGAIATALAVFHLPLPWDPAAPFVPPTIYLVGMWVAVLCGVAFVAGYTGKVAHEARQLVDALTVTELALSRQQQLSALDGLAAAAAHELGTPLATIALAAKEMRSDAPTQEMAEDIDLILDQVARCRAILGKLRSLKPGGSDIFDHASLSDIVAELAKLHEHSSAGAGKSIALSKSQHGGPEPVIARNVGLLYGLGNLIENAVQFAREKVSISAGWDGSRVVITITDDGPGFPPDLLSRLGEPYLTTRWRGGDADPRPAEGAGGLGLGVFIAKTLLERTGARLRFFNARANGHACVEISWSRAALVEEPYQ